MSKKRKKVKSMINLSDWIWIGELTKIDIKKIKKNERKKSKKTR